MILCGQYPAVRRVHVTYICVSQGHPSICLHEQPRDALAPEATVLGNSRPQEQKLHGGANYDYKGRAIPSKQT